MSEMKGKSCHERCKLKKIPPAAADKKKRNRGEEGGGGKSTRYSGISLVSGKKHWVFWDFHALRKYAFSAVFFLLYLKIKYVFFKDPAWGKF